MKIIKSYIIIVLLIISVISLIKIIDHLAEKKIISEANLTDEPYSKEKVIEKIISRMEQERSHKSYMEQEDYQQLLSIFQDQKEALNTVLIRVKKHDIEPGLIIYFEKGQRYLDDQTLKNAKPGKCITLNQNGINIKYTNFNMILMLMSDRELYNALMNINQSQMISVTCIGSDQRFEEKVANFTLDKTYFKQDDQVAFTNFGIIEEDYGILLDNRGWRLGVLGDNVFDWPYSDFLPAWDRY